MHNDQTSLAGLKAPAEYRASRTHVFPSDTSLQWFIRTQRAELIKAGAILKLSGRMLVDESAFDAAVVNIGRRDMSAHKA